MNCSYFAMERRRTFTVNKKIKQIKQKNKINYKKNIQTKKQQQADKPKQNRRKIYKTSKQGIHYTRSTIGVGAVCILMTRVVSFTLVNVYETTDEKMGFQNYANIAVA